MMFRQRVDDDINLVFLQHALAEELFEIIDADRDYLSEWLAWPETTRAVVDVETFIRHSMNGFAEGKSMSCAIEYNEAIVGIAGFNKIDHDLRRVEVGYWLARNYQGNGIITRTCGHLINYAFDELGMEKVQISAATDNTPSRNIAEGLDFTLEGIITNAENLNGRIVDHAVYGLMATTLVRA